MNTLPDLIPGQVLLVIAPEAAAAGMLDLAARLSQRGGLRVLDGGNQFNAYRVASAVRRHNFDLTSSLARITLARVFTCYQMETLLANIQPGGEPTLVMDFLSTFYDENVPFVERQRLVKHCAGILRRISRCAPVVVSARPVLPAQGERVHLAAALHAVADQILEAQSPAPAASLAPRLLQ